MASLLNRANSNSLRPDRIKLSAALLLAMGLVGCASPGLPKEPSLRLPAVVTDLEATRERDVIALHFTQPIVATDKLPLKGPISVALCRQVSVSKCNVVSHRTLSETHRKDAMITLTDTLSQDLASGPPTMLLYRVTLSNDKGRAAAASNSAYVAGGDPPAAVSALTVTPSTGGALLRWQAEPGTDFIELERTQQTPPAPPSPKQPTPASASTAPKVPRGRAGELFKPAPEPMQVRLSAGQTGSDMSAKDRGGTVDAAAQFGQSYTYIAWRVRRLTVVGHAVELRSAPSAPVTVEMRDLFPPKVPQGFTAVPSGGTSGIDLSWEPDVELDLAGYVIYRAVVGSTAAPIRLNATVTEAPAFHDASAVAGPRYRYSVAAIDQSGNESQRSVEVEESIQ